MNARSHLLRYSAVAVTLIALAGCGSDESSGSNTTTAPSPPATSPAVPATPAPPSTDDGGGGMQAGAPSFESFSVSSPVACQGGNAEATMSYSTLNVVDISIKIGDGEFAETAGYGPNETSVVASIPCNGAGSSKVQLKGCTENGDCAESSIAHVEITA